MKCFAWCPQRVSNVRCNEQEMTMLTHLKPTICLACLARSANLLLFRTSTHYAVLGVSQNATQKRIREAYIELSKKHHPDQNKDAEQISHEKFQKINEAYSVLGKDVTRKEYDRTLLNTSGTFHTWTRTHGSAPFNAASHPKYQDPFADESYNYRREWTGKEWEEYNRERTYDDKQERYAQQQNRLANRVLLFMIISFVMLQYYFSRTIRNRLDNTTDPVLEKSLAEYAKEQEELAAKAAAKASGKTV